MNKKANLNMHGLEEFYNHSAHLFKKNYVQLIFKTPESKSKMQK